MELPILYRELIFKAVRSSGPGGQHVNKTATKIELSFSITTSEAFTETQKKRIVEKLSNRISQDGILSLQCGETRSQHRNKAIVIERLVALLKNALKVAKPRKKTKPSKNAIERRLRTKKGNALKKTNRKPPSVD